MSEELRNRIKAYLIRMDMQSEDDLKQAETAYLADKSQFSAARLLGCIHHRNTVHKMLCDLWQLLDNTL